MPASLLRLALPACIAMLPCGALGHPHTPTTPHTPVLQNAQRHDVEHVAEEVVRQAPSADEEFQSSLERLIIRRMRSGGILHDRLGELVGARLAGDAVRSMVREEVARMVDALFANLDERFADLDGRASDVDRILRRGERGAGGEGDGGAAAPDEDTLSATLAHSLSRGAPNRAEFRRRFGGDWQGDCLRVQRRDILSLSPGGGGAWTAYLLIPPAVIMEASLRFDECASP